MRELLCWLGSHKWRPVGKITIDWRSKWEAYEVCAGECEHCGAEDEIRRDYYW